MTSPNAVSSELWAALDALTNRTPADVARDDGTTERVWIESLLSQLEDSVGRAGEVGGSAHVKPGSRPPAAMDIFELNVEIHTYTSRMLNAHDLPSTHSLEVNLRTIVRWLDGRVLLSIRWIRLLTRWAQCIRDLSGVDRARSRSLPIACPSCGEGWVPIERDGENVYGLAVSAVFEAGQMLALNCRACEGSWPRGDALSDLVDRALIKAA